MSVENYDNLSGRKYQKFEKYIIYENSKYKACYRKEEYYISLFLEVGFTVEKKFYLYKGPLGSSQMFILKKR